MKLSELLAKPFKVKGGGIVNLKGLSKHVIDKEIGGSSKNNKSIITTLLDVLGFPSINQEYVVDSSNNTLMKVSEIPIAEKYYYTLVKKSEYELKSSRDEIFYQFMIESSKRINIGYYIFKELSIIKNEYNIDGEIYVTVDFNY